MKKSIFSFLLCCFISHALFAQNRFITRTGHASIFSHTIAEDITASNNDVTGTINTNTGEVAISLPVQSFQFEKALMQEHFNSPRFMDSKKYPRIIFKGTIEKNPSLNFSVNGKYEVNVNGELTIKGVTRPLSSKAVIQVNGGKISATNDFWVKDIGSYGVGKPMGSKKNNVADDIEVKYEAEYDTAND